MLGLHSLTTNLVATADQVLSVRRTLVNVTLMDTNSQQMFGEKRCLLVLSDMLPVLVPTWEGAGRVLSALDRHPSTCTRDHRWPSRLGRHTSPWTLLSNYLYSFRIGRYKYINIPGCLHLYRSLLRSSLAILTCPTCPNTLLPPTPSCSTSCSPRFFIAHAYAGFNKLELSFSIDFKN